MTRNASEPLTSRPIPKYGTPSCKSVTALPASFNYTHPATVVFGCQCGHASRRLAAVTHMKRFLAQGIGLLGLLSGGAAVAADMTPFYKAPPPVAGDIWNGFYGGVNAGIGITRNPTNDTTALPGFPAPQFSSGIFSHAPQGRLFGLRADSAEMARGARLGARRRDRLAVAEHFRVDLHLRVPAGEHAARAAVDHRPAIDEVVQHHARPHRLAHAGRLVVVRDRRRGVGPRRAEPDGHRRHVVCGRRIGRGELQPEPGRLDGRRRHRDADCAALDAEGRVSVRRPRHLQQRVLVPAERSRPGGVPRPPPRR